MKRFVLLLTLALFALSANNPVFAAFQAAQPDPCEASKAEKDMNWSLYNEDYKVENWTAALESLRWILDCAPSHPTTAANPNGSDINFRRAVDIYEGLSAEAEDPVLERAYLDSALTIYDTAVSRLEDIGVETDEIRWTFDKGRFIHEHVDQLPDLQDAIAAQYLKVYEMDNTRLQPYYVEYILNAKVRAGDKADAVAFMDRVEVDFPGNEELSGVLNRYRGLLFTSPEERMSFLESKVEDNPEDVESLTELYDLYRSESMRDKVYELAPQMMEIDPSARMARSVAKMYLEDGQTTEAIALYEKSLTMPDGAQGVREVHYNIGLAHQQEGRLQQARISFRKAIGADSGYAQAYIAIGDLYVSAVQTCQEEFDKYDKAVYWLAIDYFNQAANRADNDTIRNQARQRAASYQAYLPTPEEKFFGTEGDSWEAGESYPVNYGCYAWINETTTVR